MEFGHVLGFLEPWVHHYGAATVFVILTLESFGIPLPGESLLITAAILSGRGDMSFTVLFFSAWAGAVLGDNIGYLIGRMLGHTLLWRYGGKVGLTAERLGKVRAIFTRYGPATVVFARFLNILRQLNGIFAGTMKMDWWRFLVFNTCGGALWVLVWTSAGYSLGLHGAGIAALVHKVGLLGVIFAVTVLIVILTFIYGRRILTRLKSRNITE
jgi:membrane protein DedA with SNARE-associated domain